MASISELMQKPLNELSEAEAAKVIEYKATLIANEKSFREEEELRKQVIQDRKEALSNALDEVHTTMQEMKQRALAFYNEQ